LYGRYRAFFADITGPIMRSGRIANKAALLVVLSTIVITKKVTAFKSGWSFHIDKIIRPYQNHVTGG
jgi:hypothetical protein